MKKLMFAVAALAAGFAMADGIASANTVGFTSGSTAEANNFKTIAFNSVGSNTADIQDLKITGSEGYGTETFAVWSGVPTVVDGTEFLWVAIWNSDWSEIVGYEWQNYDTTRAEFSIAQGQGVVINASEGLGITTSGQVPTEKITFTMVEGNNFTGNPFPAPLDIQNIKIVGSEGYGTETFAVWEGVPAVVDGTEFLWVAIWNDTWTEITGYEWQNYDTTRAEYTLQPNQGCVINGAAGLTVEITPPYSL